MKTTLSVLGMGRMGSALASAFLAAGHATSVWNRSRQKCAPLAAKGARVAETLEEAVEGASVVVSVLSDYAATDALLRTPDLTRALRGKLLVQLASGSPREARETAAWAREQGIEYLDGAIMATPDFIGQAGCTILYAGASALFEGHKPALLSLGGNAQYVGSDVGHASALDSALLVFMWGGLFGLLQGAVVCEAEGLSLGEYAQHLGAVTPVVNGAIEDLMQRVRERRYAADATTLAALGAHYGAFRHLVEICREHGVSQSVTKGMAELFETAMAAGRAEDDFAVLHAYMR